MKQKTLLEKAFCQSLIKFIDSEVERKKGMRKVHREFECNGANNGRGCHEDWCAMETCVSKDAIHCKGFNSAIDEDITYLTSIKNDYYK